MKKSKIIISLILSAVMSISALPTVSNAEDYNYSEAIPTSVQPYTVDGNSVIFEGSKYFDFIVSGISEFDTERADNYFKFTPTIYNSGSFLISRIYLEEEIIDMDYIVYDIDENAPPAEMHFHYFYPVIQNFSVTYNINTGTNVEYLGETSYRNEKSVSDIKSGEISGFYYFEEYDTEKIYNNGAYYSLASNTIDNNIFFTFFDYGYESETNKDKSVFCMKTPYISDEENSYINISGNAEITNTFYSESSPEIDDIFSYTTIEPISDGFVEVYSFDIFPMSSIILEVVNGKFRLHYGTIGCVMPDICDLNMDEYINISDAVIFQKYMFGKTKLTKIQYEVADTNYDGSVDIFDMVFLRKRIIEDRYVHVIPLQKNYWQIEINVL